MGFFSKFVKEKKDTKDKKNKKDKKSKTPTKKQDINEAKANRAEFIPAKQPTVALPEREVYQIPIRNVSVQYAPSESSAMSRPKSIVFPPDGYDFNIDQSWSYQACRYRLNMITLE